MSRASHAFRPERYEEELAALIGALEAAGAPDAAGLHRILRRHPKDGRGFFSKSEIIRGFRHLKAVRGWDRPEAPFVARLRMKPVRTASGVAPVTVLTKPFPCPGRCIFCPSDVRMPKSYLSDEPGAQRAAQHRFDPYDQSLSRLTSYHNTGHRTDKVELIVLGGTWSYYPEPYQVWFVKRCFDALNGFGESPGGEAPSQAPAIASTDDLAQPVEAGGGRCEGRRSGPVDSHFDRRPDRQSDERIDGRRIRRGYNRIVRELEARQGNGGDAEQESWEELARVQRLNETAAARCVGLVVETRPDHLSLDEVRRIRRLGATKVQIGIQSLSDRVLRLNRRGHDVAATRRALRLLRGAGFKLHAHWMPNLYGSSPAEDVADFERLFTDPDFRPDELKVYPCSLIESAELMARWEDGSWRPYTRDELLWVLAECLRRAPAYCRLTRVVRDIPGTDIVAGNRETNFREVAERHLDDQGLRCRDVRAREVRGRPLDPAALRLERIDYATSIGREVFLQLVGPAAGPAAGPARGTRLAGFLRLSLPDRPAPLDELEGSALLREVHVYGRLAALDGGRANAQHLGLGRRLVEHAALLAHRAGHPDLAVISAVGTRDYYRRLGFTDGPLYQHRRLGRESAPPWQRPSGPRD